MSDAAKPRVLAIAGFTERYRLVDGHLEIWFASDGQWIRQMPSKWTTVDAWQQEAGRLRADLSKARAIISLFGHPFVEDGLPHDPT